MEKLERLQDYVDKGSFYKAVVEDGADIIFIVDYDGNILYHNPSVRETLGYPPKSLISKNFFKHLHPESRKSILADFKRIIDKPYADNIEFLFLCGDSTYKYLEFNSINLKHKEGIEGLILDCRDISQRKKDAEELLRAQKAKEQFLANMSHEIRTPINGIAGMSNLLSESNSEEDREKYLNAIKNSAENLKVIINDILDLSVIESGKLKLEKIGFSLKYQVVSVIETFMYQAREKGLELEYEIEKGVDRILLGDPVRLNQILINLINNAVKFTHVGKIYVGVKLKQQSGKTLHVEFSVKDTGVGIPEEKLDTIFDSFSQADESVTRRYGGTGLGLSICKQLVALQQGTMLVESEENEGTTFRFTIPYTAGEAKDLIKIKSRGSNTELVNNDQLAGKRILMVEDNDINRMYAVSILKKWKCEIDTAENGYIALERIRNHDYDIILMDVQMPVMDGYEATKNIRKTLPPPKSDTPIIALTANAIKGDSDKCFAAGMNDYISKPFVPEDLYMIITKYTRQVGPKKAVKSGETRKKKRITDLSYLKKVSNADKRFMQDMIEAFVNNTPSSIKEMKGYLEKSEWESVSQVAHKIKPSATLMGMDTLKPLIHKIEQYGRDGTKTEEIPDLVGLLSEKCKIACQELTYILQKEF